MGLRIHQVNDGGYIVFTVEDSGVGFEFLKLSQNPKNETIYSGRGLMLVKSLCKQLRFYEPGNKAEVIYIWNNNM